ncbi:YARHG domain-containing protein [Prosthecobacter sp.]|uniref:YARHG domain-containing protein n=1 Tax=Prosthecobacter sp. TaxID=1965333 RepID=UPI003784001F
MSLPPKTFLLSAFAFVSLLLSAAAPCHAQPKVVVKNDEVAEVSKDATAMVGTYVGFFGDLKITLSIEKIVGETVLGYSIVNANQRAFSGSWQALPEGIHFLAKEPGDNAEDGNFSMTFNRQTKDLAGRWEPNDSSKTPVELALKPRKFKYDPKAGQFPKASTKLLKTADVENLRQAELRLMRNEIYARHGYTFTITDMQQHFATQDWYMPMVLDVTTKLTDIETKNAALIKRYETYGAQYYDRFGR